jgi:hypothetical protein
MKKTLVALILIILQLFSINSFAGDTDTYFAVNDNAKLFTATVVLAKSEIVELQVIKKIKGDVVENQIMQMPYFEYNARKDRTPKLGDSCFVAFVKGGTFYSVKTTTTNPETLKFINHLTNASMNMQGQSIDERIEKNINDGTYEKAEKRRQEELSKKNMNKNSESVIKPEISSSKINLRLILSILGGLILIFGGTVFLKNRKMKHQD